jgi:hypothetical protein
MRITPFLLAIVLLAPASARADADPAADPEVARLLKAKQAIRWNMVPPGRTEKVGHAEALVEAVPEKLRDAFVDFGHYKDLHRKFSSARVVGKEGDNVDVYLRLPVSIGPIKVDQYGVLRFGPAKKVGETWMVEGRQISGNMKNGFISLSARPVGPKHSLLKIDIFLAPSMPAPQSIVDEELRDAAFDLANAMKDKSQGFSANVVSLQ